MKNTLMIFLIAISTTAHGNAVRGAGAFSCGMYNENANSKTNKGMTIKALNAQWALGYLSAMNQNQKADFLEMFDADVISGAITLYCQNNPLNSLADASEFVRLEMIKKSLRN